MEKKTLQRVDVLQGVAGSLDALCAPKVSVDPVVGGDRFAGFPADVQEVLYLSQFGAAELSVSARPSLRAEGSLGETPWKVLRIEFDIRRHHRIRRRRARRSTAPTAATASRQHQRHRGAHHRHRSQHLALLSRLEGRRPPTAPNSHGARPRPSQGAHSRGTRRAPTARPNTPAPRARARARPHHPTQPSMTLRVAAGSRRTMPSSASVTIIWQPRREVWVRPKARSSMSSSSSPGSPRRS